MERLKTTPRDHGLNPPEWRRRGTVTHREDGKVSWIEVREMRSKPGTFERRLVIEGDDGTRTTHTMTRTRRTA